MTAGQAGSRLRALPCSSAACARRALHAHVCAAAVQGVVRPWCCAQAAMCKVNFFGCAHLSSSPVAVPAPVATVAALVGAVGLPVAAIAAVGGWPIRVRVVQVLRVRRRKEER